MFRKATPEEIEQLTLWRESIDSVVVGISELQPFVRGLSSGLKGVFVEG